MAEYENTRIPRLTNFTLGGCSPRNTQMIALNGKTVSSSTEGSYEKVQTILLYRICDLGLRRNAEGGTAGQFV